MTGRSAEKRGRLWVKFRPWTTDFVELILRRAAGGQTGRNFVSKLRPSSESLVEAQSRDRSFDVNRLQMQGLYAKLCGTTVQLAMFTAPNLQPVISRDPFPHNYTRRRHSPTVASVEACIPDGSSLELVSSFRSDQHRDGRIGLACLPPS